MGHYYAEMVGPSDDEIKEGNRRRAQIEYAVRLGVIAGIEAGKNSVCLDRGGPYAKKVRVSDVVKRVMRSL